MKKLLARTSDMTGRLMLFTRDPGGANQLIGLHEILCDNIRLEDVSEPIGLRDITSRLEIDRNKLDLVIYSKDFALPVWQIANISALDWDLEKTAEAIDSDALAEILRDMDIHAVVTGTSDIDDQTDHEIWRACKLATIPVCAIVDSNQNLAVRFLDNAGRWVLPDHIYLRDKACVDQLRRDGLPPEMMHIIGDLHHDRIRTLKINDSARSEVRCNWQVGREDYVILFLSDCASEMKAAGRESDYDEYECLQKLLDELSEPKYGQLPTTSDSKITVIIRPHPKDVAGKYVQYLRQGRVTVRISTFGTGIAALQSAEFVTGMKSALLREAAVLKLDTSSVLDWTQPTI
jgi:hypothetical protein